ncbi:uncharacterized, partial [Tachysurus ichikawai]
MMERRKEESGVGPILSAERGADRRHEIVECG